MIVGDRFSRKVLATVVVAPLLIMAILAITVLWPALRDPNSKIYSSSIGYPALKRLIGQPIKVETVTVVKKTLKANVAAPGESVALQEVTVGPLVTGTVEQVYVVEGHWVRKGQPLLRVNRVPFLEQVNRTRHDVATAESTLNALQKSAPERIEELKANVESARARLAVAEAKFKQIGSMADVEQKANVETAKARLDIAEAKLKQLRVLFQKGGIALSQLYDSEEAYLLRKKELISAQQGSTRRSQLYDNQDVYFLRQNELISAQQNLVRTQQETDKQIETARLTLENSKISLAQALRNLNQTVLYASIDGLVSRVNIHSGEVAETRTPVITLTQDVVFKAYIDQARLNQVKIGNQTTIRLVAYPGRTFQGKVFQLNPTVQTDVGKPGKVGVDRQYTYSAWITVKHLQMPPGLQGYAEFDQGKEALVVPENAITHLSAGEGMVMVAEKGQAVVKKVQLGKIFDNQREVIEGLRTGEQVVLSPRALNPSDELKIQANI